MLFVVVFLFSTCSFPTCCLGFQFFFVSIIIFCKNALLSCSFPTLLGLHCLVVCCCFLVVYLFISLVVVWVSDFLCFFKLFFTKIHLFIDYGY